MTDDKGSEVTDARRLFLGVRISLGAIEDMVRTVESMQPVARSADLAVRWLAPESYHITLKFLGWTKKEVEPVLREAVGQAVAGSKPFDLTLKGLGAFPSPKKARVVWAGVDRGKDELVQLARSLDGAAAELGFEPEKRELVPHVTFGRLKNSSDTTGLLLPFSEDRFRKTRVNRVVLFESVTHSKGAEYNSRAEWALG
ncbi:MAG: RNA 2',3'-cyclic phosphodiesterase [Deltaproteobacteria bacterium]|nr:RNA 2',3'-cyclic phosphodiesterase [Deltaproteobacteria bacterium]